MAKWFDLSVQSDLYLGFRLYSLLNQIKVMYLNMIENGLVFNFTKDFYLGLRILKNLHVKKEADLYLL